MVGLSNSNRSESRLSGYSGVGTFNGVGAREVATSNWCNARAADSGVYRGGASGCCGTGWYGLTHHVGFGAGFSTVSYSSFRF